MDVWGPQHSPGTAHSGDLAYSFKSRNGSSSYSRELSGPRKTSSPTRSPPRTPHSLHPSTRESITSSKVFRDLSPQKVFDAATDYESKTSLPGLFKLRNGLQSLRPTYSEDVRSSLEEDQLRQPKLLQSLEAFLDERLAVVNRVGSNSKGYAAAKMRTDAHQQVFDAFLHSFTTYRSLLTRIKNEYDRSLDDALRSVFDHVHMQAELTTAQEQLDMAIRNAQQGAMEDAADARREIQDEVEQQEALAREAEASVESAQEETSAIRAEIARLREEEAELAKANHLALQQLFQQSSFASSLQQPSQESQEPG